MQVKKLAKECISKFLVLEMFRRIYLGFEAPKCRPIIIIRVVGICVRVEYRIPGLVVVKFVVGDGFV